MPQLGMAPPPAQDVSQQMSPFAMASQRPAPPAPGQDQGQGGADPGQGNPVAAQVYTALIHLQQAMQQEPELAPAFSSAIKTIQVALGNVLGNKQGGPGPAPDAMSSAKPPDSPGVGLPI